MLSLAGTQVEVFPMLIGRDQTELSRVTKKFSPEKITLLRAKDTHSLYRLSCKTGSYLLKWFHTPAPCLEPKIYTLLNQWDIPTLPVYAQTECSLVLEDLQSSPGWRLAEDSDLERAVTGEALAEWYRKLHQAGHAALKDPGWQRYGVSPWVEEINTPALEKAGEVFRLAHVPGWHMAIRQAEILKAQYLALPQTFIYNDFTAENLALSRERGQPLRAIVFDYDCFTTGAAYSDWRNVMFSLQGPARIAFEESYGPPEAAERLLEETLAILYGLVIAARREKKPSWADPLVECVVNGELERWIRNALG